VAFVGRKARKQIRELAEVPGVAVSGTVDDVGPDIAKAAVYIVPLRIGGGSRLKILEAMAMKKAVVSTSIGAEGLHVQSGDQILIQDEPNNFAVAVLTCLDDAALRKRLGIHGGQLVAARYRWEDLAGKLHNYIVQIAKKSKTSESPLAHCRNAS